MNCQAAQRQISAARDGALGAPEQAALEEHLAECAGCRELRDSLAAAAEVWRSTVASAPVPDAKIEWRRIQLQMSPAGRRAPARRPALWWGLSLAAAAGLALAVWTPAPSNATASESEFVELGDGTSSATVYKDAQSGWLVVWAVNDADRI